MKLRNTLDGRRVLRLPTGQTIRIANLWSITGLLIAALVLAFLSLQIGTTDITPGVILDFLTGSSRLDPDQVFALDIRLPRIILAFMAGACVAMSGALLQALARNPLADPGLFGFGQGSMVVIILLLVFFPALPKSLVPIAALAGGMLVAGLLVWLSGGGHASGLAILLMGIAIETVLSSVTAILILYTPGEMSLALADWLAGSLFDASWPVILTFMPWCICGLAAALSMGRKVSVYELGEHMAMALGETVKHSRPVILICAVLLNSAAVTVVGPLAFLGMIAPNLAGFISEGNDRFRLVIAAMTGGVLVMAADALSRSLSGNIALPIGLSLTLVGGPLFVAAIRLRHLRVRTH